MVWPASWAGIDRPRGPGRFGRAGDPAENPSFGSEYPLHLIRVMPAQEVVLRVLDFFCLGFPRSGVELGVRSQR